MIEVEAYRPAQSPSVVETDILAKLLRYKWLILPIVLAGAIGGYVIASTMDRAWRAYVTVMPANDDGQSGLLGGLSNQLGGLSALTGLNLPGDSSRNEFIATLRSDELAREFVTEYKLVALFCANELIDCEGADPAKPTALMLREAAQVFGGDVLTIEDDKRAGLVRVYVTWVDRELAARWANSLIETANRKLQQRAIDEARRRLEFLRDVAQKTDLVPLRDAVYRLMESQIKSEMYAKTRADYGFRIIDSATAPGPREYVRPKRAVMAAAGGVVSFLLVAMWVAWRKERASPATR